MNHHTLMTLEFRSSQKEALYKQSLYTEALISHSVDVDVDVDVDVEVEV